MRINVLDLAKMINDNCKNHGYFWVYGLVKETINLWHSEKNRELLCYEARIMYDQVTEV